MDIMELGAIGELVGGVAVVATLVYLAIQARIRWPPGGGTVLTH